MTNTLIPSTTMVTLFRYNSQKSEFELNRTIKVPADKVDIVANEFSLERSSVKGFYKYSWIKADGTMGDLYCVSPSVFDKIEISQI